MQLRNPSLFQQACFVNGQWIQSSDKAVIAVTNPFDNSHVGNVPSFTAKDTQNAIAAATAAWPGWSDRTAKERALCLHKFYSLILENIDDLATILTLEQGKPLAESKGEILLGAEYLPWYAEEARRHYGQVIPHTGKGKQPVTFSQSIGVAALISPWNFPSSMLTRKLAAALAAGCAIVAKPASATPFSALAIAALATEAGIPAGVYNVVTGKASTIGAVLCQSPDVRALSFTGSTEVGKQLMADCAATVKKVSMELGGNAPYIVFDDANLDHAAHCILGCKFRNAGQTCVCANRLLVQRSVYEPFIEKLIAKVSTLRMGNGLESGVTQGPLISVEAADHMQGLVNDAVSKGATVRLGGKKPALGPNFFEATILTDVTPDMRVFREEIFGPLVPITPFDDEAQAIQLANDTPFGLASYLFASDIGRIWRMSRKLDYGMVGVNEVALAAGEVPFGGVKESGLGREGGTLGLEEYMETKYVLLGNLE